MAVTKIIAKGKAKQHHNDFYLEVENPDQYFPRSWPILRLGGWVIPFLGQTLIISVEEPEEESLEGRLVRPLKRVLQNA